MLTLATWNLENFTRPAKESDPKWGKYQDKLKHLAETIKEIDPDILAVQEVYNPRALDDLGHELDGEWHSITSEHPDPSPEHHIRVGFLSKLPFERTEQVVTFPAQLAPIQQDDSSDREHEMGRGALHVRVQKDGVDVDLVTCHLKSKLLSFPSQDGHPRFDTDDEGERARFGAYALFRRAAEADTVREYVNQLLEGQGQKRCVAVLGDMNDQPSAATTQMLQGPPGSEFLTPGFDHPDKGDGMRLWNIAPLIPESERYSRTFEGHKELIDHILVSHRLAYANPKATVHHDNDESIGGDPDVRRDKPTSDHDPVVAYLPL